MAPKSINKVVVGAGILATVTALALYFRNQRKQKGLSDDVRSVPREKVVQALKDFHKGFFSTYSNIAMMIQQITQQSRGQVPLEDIKEYAANNPQMIEEIKSIEKAVYQKHDLTEKDFKHAVQGTYKDDQEIQRLAATLHSQYTDALRGQPPDPKTEIPEFLTKEKTLEILEKIFKQQCKKMQEAFRKLKDEGLEINMQDPKVIQTLNNIKLDDVKTQVLKEYNLTDFEDPPQKILQYATQKFSNDDKQFASSMMQLEIKHQNSMRSIMMNPSAENSIEDNFNQAPPQRPNLRGFQSARDEVIRGPPIEVNKSQEQPAVEKKTQEEAEKKQEVAETEEKKEAVFEEETN